MPGRVLIYPRLYSLLLLLGFSTLIGAQGSDDVYTRQLRKFCENPVFALSEGWQLAVNGGFATVNNRLPLLSGEKLRELSLEKSFRIDPSLRNHALRLLLNGVHGAVKIYFNGNLLRSRSAHISTFFVDIPANLIKYNSENMLRLQIVKNSKLPASPGWFTSKA